MIGLPKVPFIAILLICIVSQVESDEYKHRYSEGDIVPFYANIVGPFSNPRETYAYYDLPFCSPDIVKEKTLNLGEMLNGDRLVSTPYKLEFLVDKYNEVLCNKTLSKRDVSRFRSLIENDYFIQLYYDDLAMFGPLETSKRNLYVVTSVVSGYTSVSFYSQLEGTTWIKNLFLTGGIYFGPLFLTFGFLNSIAVFYGTTVALPLREIVMLSLIWIFLASPLLLLGGIVGKNRTSDFNAPFRTAKCPREIPKLRWYRGLLPQMALAGILPFGVIYVQLYYIFSTVWGFPFCTLYSVLSVVFFLLLIITALVSVALTYFQLAVEDHEWWWRSFFCGGSTGLFMYVYCIWYYFARSNMSGFMQTSFFFGYMACVCYGMFLVLGSVGFRASLLFVRYLYAAIKCD